MYRHHPGLHRRERPSLILMFTTQCSRPPIASTGALRLRCPSIHIPCADPPRVGYRRRSQDYFPEAERYGSRISPSLSECSGMLPHRECPLIALNIVPEVDRNLKSNIERSISRTGTLKSKIFLFCWHQVAKSTVDVPKPG